MEKRKKTKTIQLPKRFDVLKGIFLLMTFFNIASWYFPKAINWYRMQVFPVWTNTLARVMSVFPFSVGEILIYTGIFFLIIGFFLFWCYILKIKRTNKFGKVYFEILCWILLWVYLTETLNCFVLYHATTVEQQFFDNKTYSNQELLAVYEELITQANALSLQMQRDSNGNVIYQRNQMYQECKKAMKHLGRKYPYLSGYYPNPKPIIFSDFMSQQYLCGIYFPFTLESNYNTTMYIMNDPATICHEFSHLKGVILEDEANYFGFAACIQSQNKFLQYSGYLSVLSYVGQEVKKNATESEIASLTKANDYVRKDIVFLTKDSWNKVEKKAVVSTKTANAVTDKFLQSNLKMNGVSDGMVSYSRVVRLVLDYYKGK